MKAEVAILKKRSSVVLYTLLLPSYAILRFLNAKRKFIDLCTDFWNGSRQIFMYVAKESFADNLTQPFFWKMKAVFEYKNSSL